MDVGVLLATIGSLLLAGLALDALGRFTRVPRITLLVLFGLAIGPAGVDILPIDVDGWREIAANLALTMVAFLLGGAFSRKGLAGQGAAILWVSIAVTFATLACIVGGLALLGTPLALAALLAGVGLATDPAATRDVVRETRSAGPATGAILGVVAVDDAWGVIVFSLILGVVNAAGVNGAVAGVLDGVAEVASAALLGAVVGLPGAYATGRIAPGEPTLAEALGIVLLIVGLSMWLDVSFLIAGMTAGAIIVNLARHHDYPFHEIEHISWPFLIVFFVMAGAAVEPAAIWEAGALGAAFVLLRVAGRVLGGWIGGRAAGLPHGRSLWIGVALMPQAGVGLGLALVAAQAAPAYGDTIVTVAVGAMVLFELFGPLATRLALARTGEAGAASK